ncbi:MAG: hypothetical protein RJA70_4420, partial [Pseudomonadota bacterium]
MTPRANATSDGPKSGHPRFLGGRFANINLSLPGVAGSESPRRPLDMTNRYRLSNSWVIVSVLLCTLSCGRTGEEEGGPESSDLCVYSRDCQSGESCVEGECVDPDSERIGTEPYASTPPTSRGPGVKRPRPTPNGVSDAGV